jgi:hypothetical protein
VKKSANTTFNLIGEPTCSLLAGGSFPGYYSRLTEGVTPKPNVFYLTGESSIPDQENF